MRATRPIVSIPIAWCSTCSAAGSIGWRAWARPQQASIRHARRQGDDPLPWAQPSGWTGAGLGPGPSLLLGEVSAGSDQCRRHGGEGHHGQPTHIVQRFADLEFDAAHDRLIGSLTDSVVFGGSTKTARTSKTCRVWTNWGSFTASRLTRTIRRSIFHTSGAVLRRSNLDGSQIEALVASAEIAPTGFTRRIGDPCSIPRMANYGSYATVSEGR